MGDLNAEHFLFGLAGLLAAALVLAGLWAWRNALVRRRRAAVRNAGMTLAFDACAPEGGDVTLEPFRLSRLRIEGTDGVDAKRHD